MGQDFATVLTTHLPTPHSSLSVVQEGEDAWGTEGTDGRAAPSTP